MAKDKHKGQPDQTFYPDPGLNRRTPRTQDDRIEQALSDFVEAFLGGKASVEVAPGRGIADNGFATIATGFTIRLKRD